MGSNGAVLITILPNPVKELLTINVYGTQGGEIEISDVSGRITFTAKVVGSLARVDVSGLSAGTYFVRYVNEILSKTITFTKW